jgi:cyclophilin family peptidyl-prolyl cis-trans isomerase
MPETKQWKQPPKMIINTDYSYKATIETELGNIELKLFADMVPKTVNNFVFLSREGFYNNTIFHRVISNFMAQAGDPTGKGIGGPGYKFEDEFHPKLRHDKAGILSMANAGPGTNGSQFFITYVPTPWLDDKHTVFGEVVEGQNILLSIPPRDPQRPDNPGIKIKTIHIEEITNA